MKEDSNNQSINKFFILKNAHHSSFLLIWKGYAKLKHERLTPLLTNKSWKLNMIGRPLSLVSLLASLSLVHIQFIDEMFRIVTTNLHSSNNFIARFVTVDR